MKKINPYRLIFTKGILPALFFLFIPLISSAQVFWTENFNNGCAANCAAVGYTGVNGAWTQTLTGTNGADNNVWYVSCAENGHTPGVCGTGCAAASPTATLATLHLGSNASVFGDIGAAFLNGGFGFFDPVTDLRIESPTINCSGKTNITLSFNYIENGAGTIDDATLWYFNGTVWTQLDPIAKTTIICPSAQGLWTAFSITLPASANNNPNVKIGFRWVNNDDSLGDDPSFAVDDITLSTPVTGNTIITGLITGSPFCACSSVNVPFTSTGTFTAGNIYTAELSNAAGSFAAPVAIGTLASTANSGTIAATIPCGTPTGSGYRIRVVSSAPATTGTDNGVNITITQPSTGAFSYATTPYCSNEADPSPVFSGGGIAGTFSSTTGLVFVSAATGQVDLSASTAGTYTVTNTIAASGGCPAVVETSTITITALPVGTFSYTGTPFCADEADPSPTFSGGGVAGAFSSTAGLVFVSAATGQVDLSASTAGTYTVTNTIAATGGCPSVVETSSIIIDPVRDSTFSYTGSTFCQSGTDPVPVITGTPGGVFTSSPAGLVFVSTATGEIDLSASTLGTYSVTYTTPGPCATAMSVSVTITTSPASTFSYTGTPYCSDETDPLPAYSGGGSAGVFSSTAGLVFVSTATGEVDLSASTAGSYTVTNTIAASGGCPASTSTSVITITTPPVGIFSYPGSPYCSDGANALPVFTGGGTAGTFSSTAGLVFVNTGTGEVNVAASAPGTYTITNTLAASGGCPAVIETSGITIDAFAEPGFLYLPSSYCVNGADASPTFVTGGSAGTFSSSGGLVFVSTSTGQVDVSASTPGTYTVTNTIAASGGCPAASATSPVTIDPAQDSAFAYSSAEFCQSGTTTPTVNTPGGTFTSSSAGLVFISTTTGEIDLAGSSVGTYNITYTTPGPCASSMSVSISIVEPPTADFSYTP
ncbi:MAG TPA: hypothetical protein VF868_06010, partial [Bacteroidia bacterium]